MRSVRRHGSNVGGQRQGLAYEPKAMKECLRIYRDRDALVLLVYRNQAVMGADALSICSEGKEVCILTFD